MSGLAAEHGAVNLDREFPEFDCDPALVCAVTHAMTVGMNQYPPMPDIPVLREATVTKLASIYGSNCDSTSEATMLAVVSSERHHLDTR